MISAIGKRVTKNHTTLKFVAKDREVFGGNSALFFENHLKSLIYQNKLTDSPVVIVIFGKDHFDDIMQIEETSGASRSTTSHDIKD